MHPMMSRPDGVTDCSELRLSHVALLGAVCTSAVCPVSHQGMLDGCRMVGVPIVNNSQLTVGFFGVEMEGSYISFCDTQLQSPLLEEVCDELHVSSKHTLYLAPKPVCMQQCQIIYWMISQWHQMRFSISLAVGVRETARQHSAFASSQL